VKRHWKASRPNRPSVLHVFVLVEPAPTMRGPDESTVMQEDLLFREDVNQKPVTFAMRHPFAPADVSFSGASFLVPHPAETRANLDALLDALLLSSGSRLCHG